MENNSSKLQHHGILGMKWGVRRFQNKDGSLTKAGKKRYDGDDDPEKSKEEYEEGKQRALKSGSASDVLKYKGDLTKQEMESAISRIRWERDMKDISDKEVAETKQGADKFFNKMGKVTDYAVTGAKAYNMAANIINAFSGTDSISLPKIDTNITNGNKDTRKKEKKEKRKEEEAQKKREEQESQKEAKRAERAKKKAEKQDDTETATGDIVGQGTSKRSNKSSDKSSGRDNTTIDLDDDQWTDKSGGSSSSSSGKQYANNLLGSGAGNTSASNPPANSVSAGQSYVAGFLPPPSSKDD